MTSTPVTSDVGSVLMNLTAQPAKNDRAGENFSDVLSKQTQTEKTTVEDSKVKTGTVKVENCRTDHVKNSANVQDETECEPAMEDSEIAKAAEELASQMFSGIASKLGISTEELEKVLEELGVTMMDLLQPNNMMQVFVTAGGVEDTLQLLTNEELYASYMSLNADLTAGLEEIARLTGKEVSQIQDLLSQISGQNADPAQEIIAVADESVTQTGDVTETNADVADAITNQAKEPANVLLSARNENQAGEEQHSDTKGQDNLAKETPFMVTNQLQQQVEIVTNEGSYTETVYSAETQMIMDQILDFMKIQVGDGITRLEMQLQPESLGTVQVQIAAKDGVITAQFTAQNEMVKNALESQMIQLRETFDAQGIKVEAIEVAVQSQAFDRNLHQGRDGQSGSQQEPKTSGRVRRLNLNALSEETEELLDEADQLAAQMMEQNGNTVDYTV